MMLFQFFFCLILILRLFSYWCLLFLLEYVQLKKEKAGQTKSDRNRFEFCLLVQYYFSFLEKIKIVVKIAAILMDIIPKYPSIFFLGSSKIPYRLVDYEPPISVSNTTIRPGKSLRPLSG